MTSEIIGFAEKAQAYLRLLQNSFLPEHYEAIEILARELREAWTLKKRIFICGNGGSAANALHISNDLHYGIGSCGPGPKIAGLNIEALPANQGIVTCLANDLGYESIFSHQLRVKAQQQDILIALSGSGNSPNIVEAIKTANSLSMKTFAIIAFDGGKCKSLADNVIHFSVNDMQIAEDTQLIVGHICMQWLNAHKPSSLSSLEDG